MNHLAILDASHDLVYSPDDGGWYIQRYINRDGVTRSWVSELFDSETDARCIFKLAYEQIQWDCL